MYLTIFKFNTQMTDSSMDEKMENKFTQFSMMFHQHTSGFIRLATHHSWFFLFIDKIDIFTEVLVDIPNETI